jgi:hypothetical protein
VSPRTVGRYIRRLRPRRGGRRSQRWATFVRNYAHAVVACDLFTMVTARFRVLYVFVVLEVPTVTYRLVFVLVLLAHDGHASGTWQSPRIRRRRGRLISCARRFRGTRRLDT